MKNLFVFAFFLISFSLFGTNFDLVVPEVTFIEGKEGFIPYIEGCELDGVGEKPVLPFLRLVFKSRVERIEIVEKEEIILSRNLKTGDPLFRLSDMKKVQSVKQSKIAIPSLQRFFFQINPTFRGDVKEYFVNFYPVIPLAENKIIVIKKVRVFTEKADLEPFAPSKGKDSLLVLTSEMVLEKSKELLNFLAVKRAEGFRVDIATEKDYGGGNLEGIERVEKIRFYLRNVSKKYHFLLIIADPMPGGNDVPMVVTKPDIVEEKGYENVPTDIFYAEVSEEMDKNGNGIYGQREDRVVFSFEFVVGRIPVYNNNIEDVDKILARTIEYIKEKPSEAVYRKKMFFPTTIAYYQYQDGQMIPKMDGGYVVKYIKENVLMDNFLSKTLVEKEGASPSEFSDEEAINYDSVLKSWNDGFGTVYWMGHGMPTYSVRTVWSGDRNNNGFPDSYEMKSDVFVDSEMTEKMTHIAPFVFQGSCLNGTIQNSRNLAYTVLLNSAVGVVGSSQVSYGSIFSDYNVSSQDLFAYGTIFVHAIASNKFPAEELQDKKEKWSSNSVLLTIKMETNYFGDPSLNLNMIECEKNEDCDDQIFCNGTELCNEGYCEKNFDAMPCNVSQNPCRMNTCDEISKSCVEVFSPEGLYCGDLQNLCYSGRQCFEGECIETGAKDCSKYDSECSTGVCNIETAECELISKNEGDKCDDGLFCTTEGKCIAGVCESSPVEMPSPKPCSIVECDNNAEDFVYLIDRDQNWDECLNEEGKKGVCYYGVCQINDDEKSDSNKKSSSGCSVVVF